MSLPSFPSRTLQPRTRQLDRPLPPNKTQALLFEEHCPFRDQTSIVEQHLSASSLLQQLNHLHQSKRSRTRETSPLRRPLSLHHLSQLLQSLHLPMHPLGPTLLPFNSRQSHAWVHRSLHPTAPFCTQTSHLHPPLPAAQLKAPAQIALLPQWALPSATSTTRA